MKILIIGQGGREHALAKAFRRSPSVTEVHVAPGNDGMRKEAQCHPLNWKNPSEIVHFCQNNQIDFVFIGPDDPVVEGLADQLRAENLRVVGPSKEGARLEGSKIFAKEFMAKAQIPTAAYAVVNSVASTLEKASQFTPPYVLKADGLAAGKGVFICQNLDELKIAATELFDKKVLGTAGSRALLEQFMPGWELSLIFLTNGESYSLLPLAQDHKRLREENKGPNTGGMGSIAPLHISDSLKKSILTKIIDPTIAQLKKDKVLYRGVVFIGLMITEDGPYVVEYNVRFGDPETQVILPLIENDLGVVFDQLSRGELVPIQIKDQASCCVVLAAEGYPHNPVKGIAINGDVFEESENGYFIHAGTKQMPSKEWITNGGRVLCSIGIGKNHSEAIQHAYQQAETVRWKGIQWRRDIGKYIP